MCNRYTPPKELDIEREWHVGNRNPSRWWDEVLYPRRTGPFIRRARDTLVRRGLAGAAAGCPCGVV